MVSRGTEKRGYPAYALSRIRELARQGKVRYLSARAQHDIENLGYEPDDIHECLANLEESDFDHAETYLDFPGWYDVYHVVLVSTQGHRDRPYIKLRLTRDVMYVELRSFHVDRWL
ncbi:MAG: type II toxin-antitoxin system MqsR family toxin [Gammaproteobacteria bacterium]